MKNITWLDLCFYQYLTCFPLICVFFILFPGQGKKNSQYLFYNNDCFETYLSQDGCLLSCCNTNGLLGNGGGTRCSMTRGTGCALFPGTPWLTN